MLNVNKRKYKKFTEDIKFNNHACFRYLNSIYIFNGKNLYTYDITNDELFLLKPLLFSPEPVKYLSLFISNGFLFLIGTMKYMDDCFIFKTQIENLQPQLDLTKPVSYDVSYIKH
jgi:hypothetical protein